jgi:1,4-dihydroxy-2-naphthoate polyprenyltransferase
MRVRRQSLRPSSYYRTLIRDFWIALRPLSLTLAVASTTTGIVIAQINGFLIGLSPTWILWLVSCVLIAGLLTQSGANLINDYFEGSFHYHRKAPRRIRFLGATRSVFDIGIFLSGLACFGGAALIGLYLIWLTDLYMLLIGLVGIAGAYAYTGEPFAYKRKALGAPLSFILMGPLMVAGAYYVFAQSFSFPVFFYSLPISFFIPSLMLSNEMRDYLRDKDWKLGTLSVRFGASFSKRLYLVLLCAAYLSTLLLILSGMLSLWGVFVFLTLPLAIRAYRSVSSSDRRGIPKTNLCHFVFSVIYLTALLFS